MTNELDTLVPFTKRHDLLLSNHDRMLDDHAVERRRIGLLMEENSKDTKLILGIVLNTQSRMA